MHSTPKFFRSLPTTSSAGRKSRRQSNRRLRIEQLEARTLLNGLSLLDSTFFGGAGDQRGTDIEIDGSDIFVSVNAVEGQTAGDNSFLVKYDAPAETNASPAFSKSWTLGTLNGIAAHNGTVYGAGHSHPGAGLTNDGTGGAEVKGLLTSFDANNASGPGPGGSNWSAPIPQGTFNSGPGNSFFVYNGVEIHSDAIAVDDGSDTFIYTVGNAQPCSHTTFAVAKYDSAGNVVAGATAASASFTTCAAPQTAMGSVSGAVELGGNIYVAGGIRDSGGVTRPTIWQYDADLNVLWKKQDPAIHGNYLSVATDGTSIYAVGASAGDADYLIAKYDQAGNQIWSTTSGNVGTAEVLQDVLMVDGRLFAVGYTDGSGAGGDDMVVMEINPSDGSILSTETFGGAQRDRAARLASDGTDLYVVGESRSFAEGGNVLGQNDAVLLRYRFAAPNPAPEITSLSVDAAMIFEDESVTLTGEFTDALNPVTTTVFLEDFESYADGSNLIGQGGWMLNPGSQVGTTLVHSTGSLPGRGSQGREDPGVRGLAVADNIFAPSGLSNDRVYELSFDSIAWQGSPLTAPSHNSGVYIHSSASSFGAGWFMERSGNSVRWQFDARGLTGNAGNLQTFPYGLGISVPQTGPVVPVELSIFLDPGNNEVYGLADFGSGTPVETTHYSMTDAQFAAVDGVLLHQEYRINTCACLGAEFDNIQVSEATQQSDEHTVEVDWGDGNVEMVTLPVGDRSFSIPHQYLDDGDSPGNGTPQDDYTINVSVSDDGGGIGTAATGAAGLELDFALGLGSSGNDVGMDVVTDAAGNAYVAGVLTGTIDFDPGPGVFNLTGNIKGEPFVAKYSPTGELIWARDFDSSGNGHSNNSRAVAVDSHGNVYLAGEFHGTMDSDPGSLVNNLNTNSSLGAGFLIKLDSGGNFLWSHQLQLHSPIFSVAVDTLDNLYYSFNAHRGATIDVDPSAGVFNVVAPPGVGPTTGFIVKVDSSGSLDWVRSAGGFGQGGVGATHLAVDGSGHVYGAGSFSGTVDFDPGGATTNLISAGANDVFVWKLDNTGSFVWAKRMGGPSNDSGNDVVLDSAGNVYPVGQFEGTADFDPGASTSNMTSAGNADAFISKLDSAGNFAWARTFGSSAFDAANGVAINNGDQLLVTGHFQQTVDFNLAGGPFNLTSAGGQDGVVWHLDSNGDFLNAASGGGAGSDTGNKIAVDNQGNVLVTGSFEGAADLDPGPSVNEFNSIGGSDAFLLKVAQSAAGPVVTVKNVAPDFDAGPNETLPAGSGAFSRTGIAFTDPGTLDLHTVTIDYDGDAIIDQTINVPLGDRDFDLSHTFTESGTFLVTVRVEDDDGGSLTDTFQVDVQLNRPPESPVDSDLATEAVLEGAPSGTPVGLTADAFDPDSDTLVYTLANNAGGRFAINSSTGVVTVAVGGSALLNFEDAISHLITVQAEDPHGETSSSDFTIRVNNAAPTAPLDDDVTDNAVAENATGTVGIDVSATDPNGTAGGGNVTFSLGDSAGGRFQIDTNTGVVTVANAALLNYEDATSHDITVVADDGSSAANATSSQSFTIQVTNVNPSAPADDDAAVNKVAEAAAAGTAVGLDVSSTDPNGTAGGGNVTFSLGDNAGGRFQIDANTGVVTVANAALLNYEDASSHDITVVADDGSGAANATSSQSFTIQVTNVNPSAPADDDAAVNKVAEAAAAGTAIGLDVSSTDPNGTAGGGDVTFSLTDDAGGRFKIDAVTGVVSVKDGTLLDGPATHAVTVQASDGAGGASTADFDIDVTNVAPTITELNSANADLEQKAEDRVVTIDGSFTDPAGSLDTHTVQVDWGDGGAVETLPLAAVDQANDEFGASHTYADGGIYTIIVTVRDDDGGVSAESTTSAVASGVGLVDGTLYLIGTDDKDVFSVYRSYHRDKLIVKARLDAGRGYGYYWHRGEQIRETFELSEVDKIVVHACDGADRVRFLGSVDLPATIFGGGGNDWISGTNGDDFIDGGEGRDYIWSQGGDDTIVDTNGSNVIFGGSGNDTITAGAGNDYIVAGWGDDTIHAGDGRNRVLGGEGNDLIVGGNGNEWLLGEGGNDVILAGGGNDSINAGSGNDIVSGGAGNDWILGGRGRDLLIGGTGRDFIRGDHGDDILIAGFTDFDSDEAALGALLAEWSSASDYAARVANITGGGGSLAGLNILLDDTTVHDDNESDLLSGGRGLDLLFYNFSGSGTKDRQWEVRNWRPAWLTNSDEERIDID